MFKEVEISNALEKEIQPDNTAVISIDAYDGCQLQCPYCFQMNNKEWSCNIQIRTNIADVLKNELQILKEDETYYLDIVHKYQNNPRITFMSELWNENQ